MIKARYPVKQAILADTRCDQEKYLAMYQDSIENNEAFWAKHGQRLEWFTPYSEIKDTSFAKDPKSPQLYENFPNNISNIFNI